MWENFALYNVDLRCLDANCTLFNIWQPFTYMFMHGGFTHLFFNMFSLWMFGRMLEYELGWKRFLVYYLVCGVGLDTVPDGRCADRPIEYASVVSRMGLLYGHTHGGCLGCYIRPIVGIRHVAP